MAKKTGNDAVKLNSVEWWNDGAVKERPQMSAPADQVFEEPETIAPAAPVADTPVIPQQTQYPVQPTSGPYQVAPVIQPFVIVPYVSGSQPLRYVDKSGNAAVEDDFYDDGYFEDEYEEASSVKKSSAKSSSSVRSSSGRRPVKAAPAARVSVKGGKKSKANAFAILTFILGIIYVAAMFDFSSLIKGFAYNFLFVPKWTNVSVVGFDFIKGFIINLDFKGFDIMANLIPILFIVGALFAILTMLGGIFTCASRTPVVFKVFGGIALAAHAAIFVIVQFFKNNKLNTVIMNKGEYGLYILLGLVALMFIFIMIARCRKNKR